VTNGDIITFSLFSLWEEPGFALLEASFTRFTHLYFYINV